MPITYLEFNSLTDFTSYIERTKSETLRALALQMKRTEQAKVKYDSDIERGEDYTDETKQMDVAGFKVLMNPTAEYELKLMEETYTSLQEKVVILERTRELIPLLKNKDTKIGVVLSDGLPTGFMLYNNNHPERGERTNS